MRKFSILEQQTIRSMVDGVRNSVSYLPINAYQDIFHRKNVGFRDNEVLLVFYRNINHIDHNEILEVESQIIEISLLLGYLKENRLIYYLHEEMRDEDKIHEIGIQRTEGHIFEIPKAFDRYAYHQLVDAINHRVFVTQELKDLVANNFETYEEKTLKESYKQSWLSILATMIALIALLVSLLKDCSGGNGETEIYNDNDSTNIVVPVGVGAMLNYMKNDIEGKLDATMNNTAEIKAKLCDTISVKVSDCYCKESHKTTAETTKKSPIIKSTRNANPCIKWQKINTCEDTVVQKGSLKSTYYN